MEIEKQIVNLELSMRLKELGVKQCSIFNWFHCTDDSYELDYNTYKRNEIFPDEYISAFTVAELGHMLSHQKINSHKIGNTWYLYFFGIDHEFAGKTEADCRAKMLIYLIENGLMPK